MWCESEEKRNKLHRPQICFLSVEVKLDCDVNKTEKKQTEKAKRRPAALPSGGEELTPPQLSVLARSFPVPRGRTATGGWGFICSSSSVDRTQPTYHRSSRYHQNLLNQSRSKRNRTKAGQSGTDPHRAVAAAGEDPQIWHFSIQLQPRELRELSVASATEALPAFPFKSFFFM